MKKTLIALASVAALGAAHADVTMYGLIDLSVVHNSAGVQSDPNNPGNTNFLVNPTTSPPGTAQQNPIVTTPGTYSGATSMGSGALSASRWGIKGTEDLGGGMKAGFTMEAALNAATGTNPNDHALLAAGTGFNSGSGDASANGQMFARQATVDLSGGFGLLTMGRQATAERNATNEIDILESAGISPIGFYGGFTGMGSSYTQVADNSLKLTTPLGSMGKFIGFYSFGGAAGSQAGSQYGATVMFNPTSTVELIGNFGRMYDNVAYGSSPVIGAAGTGYYSGVSGVAATPVTSRLLATYYDSTEAVFGAKIQATENLTLKVGFITVSQQNPSNPTYDNTQTQNLGIPVAPNINTYNSTFTRTLTTVGAKYDLSGTDHLTFAGYQINYHSYNAYTSVGAVQTATNSVASGGVYSVASSAINTYDMVYDHDLSKKTDVYAALVVQQFPSTSSTNNAQSFVALGNLGLNASTVAVGLRTRF